ncbi:unnamed protein product, partial [Gongylonema pulchrum]|uniref:UBIQUITIN_CONJUGAT_2 domain-containing protein n=1 Tax=Gongylonema pulchrum TaxID=637853 RepID=A0A183E3S7_9BILA
DQFPYNAGGYKIEIEFGKEYPFKAPKIRFITKIYHPNINERGEVLLHNIHLLLRALSISMPMISAENWKPSLKVDQVLNALADLLGSPQLDCALRADLAELYVKDAKSFDQNALEFCRLYSAKRTPA